jgi:hypothetical protein
MHVLPHLITLDFILIIVICNKCICIIGCRILCLNLRKCTKQIIMDNIPLLLSPNLSSFSFNLVSEWLWLFLFCVCVAQIDKLALGLR